MKYRRIQRPVKIAMTSIGLVVGIWALGVVAFTVSFFVTVWVLDAVN